MDKLSLNTKKQVIKVSRNNSNFGPDCFKTDVFTTQKCCRFHETQIDRYLQFDEQLTKTLKKMAHAIRSIYRIRHQIPLKRASFF